MLWCERSLVVYASDSSLAGTIQAQERLIREVLPTPDDPVYGLWHEICAHDYALGGLNGWISQNDQFCAPVLQHLSLAHCRTSFPMFASGTSMSSIGPEARRHAQYSESLLANPDALRPDSIAVISMCRREGEPQKCEGMHKCC